MRTAKGRLVGVAIVGLGLLTLSVSCSENTVTSEQSEELVP